MRFYTPTMTGAIRTAIRNPTCRMAQRQQALNFGAFRSYTSESTGKKSGGSKLLLTALFGAGIAGGIAYNSSNTKVLPVAVAEEKQTTNEPKPTALDPKNFVSLKLLEVEPISHDTSVFRFALPEGHTAGLPIASCVVAKYTPEEGKPIVRPYTPVSDQEAEGYVDFIIKKYETGTLTPIIHNLKPGDSLEFKGPIPKYDWEKNQKANVGMIAGGTGITPMLQIIRRVFHEKSSDKNTKITLIFANQTDKDILLKEELDKIAKEHPDRFKVVYALDKAPEKWDGLVGYVDKEAIKKYLPSPQQEDSIIFICGPPLMVKSIAGAKDKMQQGELDGYLKELGYAKDNVFKF